MAMAVMEQKRKIQESQNYQRTKMQKDMVIQRLKDDGCRITKQRLMLLDIILEEDCSCCKEIYYKAAKQDGRIGTATVYRMVNKLEEIGAISRKNMYKIACGSGCDDDTVVELSAKKWHKVIKAGLAACGYPTDLNVRSVIAKSCQCGK